MWSQVSFTKKKKKVHLTKHMRTKCHPVQIHFVRRRSEDGRKVLRHRPPLWQCWGCNHILTSLSVTAWTGPVQTVCYDYSGELQVYNVKWNLGTQLSVFIQHDTLSREEKHAWFTFQILLSFIIRLLLLLPLIILISFFIFFLLKEMYNIYCFFNGVKRHTALPFRSPMYSDYSDIHK